MHTITGQSNGETDRPTRAIHKTHRQLRGLFKNIRAETILKYTRLIFRHTEHEKNKRLCTIRFTHEHAICHGNLVYK